MAVNTLTIGAGTLTIGTDANLTTFESQTTEVTLKPKVDTGDAIYVLSGESIAGDRTETWTLEGTFVQDFGAAGSKVEWLFTHRGQQHAFAFVPNTAAGKKVTGQLVVEAVDIGGKAKTKAMSDFSFVVVGDPTIATVA